jgi:hypothetical protein
MTDLVERDAELAAIESCMHRGGVVSIEGGAGMGKPSLRDAACALARLETRIVLWARASDLECGFAFGVARQLFERRYADANGQQRQALLAGPARSVAVLVLSRLRGLGNR